MQVSILSIRDLRIYGRIRLPTIKVVAAVGSEDWSGHGTSNFKKLFSREDLSSSIQIFIKVLTLSLL